MQNIFRKDSLHISKWRGKDMTTQGEEEHMVRVVIIGGGAAGMMAACVLFPVIILHHMCKQIRTAAVSVYSFIGRK